MPGPMSPERRHHRARVARAVQRGDNTTADLARRDLRVAKLADIIAATVAEAPPPTPEQIDRLRGLLAPRRPLAEGGETARSTS